MTEHHSIIVAMGYRLLPDCKGEPVFCRCVTAAHDRFWIPLAVGGGAAIGFIGGVCTALILS